MAYDAEKDEKSYEEMFAEAVSMIPLYTKQWTNYNRSDPGITVLENFAAFHVLQQESMKNVSEKSERSLLKLAGIESGTNRGSRFYLALTNAGEEETFFPHRKVSIGRTCAEPVNSCRLKSEIIQKILVKRQGISQDVTPLINFAIPASAAVFGNPAEAGGELLFLLKELPRRKERFSLYFNVKEDRDRTPFDPCDVPEFARLTWQCYTNRGWEMMEWEDHTAYFLTCGVIHLTMPSSDAALWSEAGETGYAVRCRINASFYDRAPVFTYVCGSFQEMEQRETLAAGFYGTGAETEVMSSMIDEDCYEVFCREEPGRDFRRYTKGANPGRHFNVLEKRPGYVRIGFDQDAYGYGPCGEKDSVLVVSYMQEMAVHRLIGTVCGYEDQVLELHVEGDVIPDDFAVLTETEDDSGQLYYRVVRPDSQEEEEPGYELLLEEKSILIHRPGCPRTCRLYHCGCAVTKGSRMQVRRGSRVIFSGKDFTVISSGEGGASYETAEELKERFYEKTGHRKSGEDTDYETWVKQTPGLRIDMVKAWKGEKNQLLIAVKPAGDDRSNLSPFYYRAITRHLEAKRQITVDIRVMGPEYIPVSIRGLVTVKGALGDCGRKLTETLSQAVTSQAAEAGFGGVIYFDRIYEAIKELEYVDSILELYPDVPAGPGVLLTGADIVLSNWCLGYFAGEYVKLIRL